MFYIIVITNKLISIKTVFPSQHRKREGVERERERERGGGVGRRREAGRERGGWEEGRGGERDRQI